jgi:hypothetical protein
MLWIEYDSTPSCDIAVLRNILERVAKIVTPFPVAAYDVQEDGIGVLVHDGFYPGYDDDSSATSSSLSRDISPSGWVDVGPDVGLIPLEMAAMEGVVSTTPAGNVTVNTSTVDDDGDTGYSNTSNNDSRDGTSSSVPGNGNTTGGGGQSRNSQTGEGGFGARNGEDEGEDDDTSRPKPPADPPVASELDLPSGTFTGRTNLCFGSSGTQELSISFDLQINPSCQPGKVNCAISLSKLVVRASDQDTISTIPETGRYVTDRVAITIGPSGRCDPPHAVSPLVPWFAERQTMSLRNQYGANFQASWYPSLSIQGSRTIGTSVDRQPVTLSIEPIRIGAGQGDDIRWFYQAHCAAETHLELSTRNPPTHEVSYGIPQSSNMPENFRIKVDVFYHRKRIPRRLKSKFSSPMFRFLKDVSARDIVMTLEAVIGKGQGDNFVFPGMNKEGCDLDLDLNFMECGNVGQGVPITGGKGCVKSQLNTATKCA